MKSYKTMKIAPKVTGKIAIVVLVVFVVFTLTIQSNMKNDLVHREQEKLTLFANGNSSVVPEFMDSMSDL